jgi:hypothetical protein
VELAERCDVGVVNVVVSIHDNDDDDDDVDRDDDVGVDDVTESSV